MFVLMAIDYLSTCSSGGIIKHSTGCARSDLEKAKNRRRKAEKGQLTEELSNISRAVSFKLELTTFPNTPAENVTLAIS